MVLGNGTNLDVGLHTPIVNALGGVCVGIFILILIILMVWYLKEKENRKKSKQVKSEI